MDYRRISSFYDSTYSRQELMDIRDSMRTNRPPMRDALSPAMKSINDAVKNMQPYVYTGMPLTTISYMAYGTTSLWWLILKVNGHCHPQEIEKGSLLHLPSLSDVDKALSGTQAVVTSKTRTIII